LVPNNKTQRKKGEKRREIKKKKIIELRKKGRKEKE
jgi:hypothetical protein